MLMMMVRGRANTLFASIIVLMSMKDVTGHTQDLELAFDREMTFLGTHDPCGHLTCRVRGNSLTLESVSVTEVKATHENKQILVVTSTHPNKEISETDIRGNGTFLENNRATLNFDLLETSICNSGYFICEVVYTKTSGERERQFATAGPGYPPRVHPNSESGVCLSNSCPPGQYTINDKVNEVKFEFLGEKLNQLIDRTATLEEKFFSLLLHQSPVAGPNATKTLENLEMRMSDVEESIGTPQNEDQPQICAPGMGDDVTKRYPPYVILSQSAIRKQILCDTYTLGGGWTVIQNFIETGQPTVRDLAPSREISGWVLRRSIRSLIRYRLRLGSYSGTIGQAAGSGLSFSNNRPFTTFDRDNDARVGENCAIKYHAAWWYGACHNSNLNGMWKARNFTGVCWKTGSSWVYPSYTEMKMRRVQSPTSG
ncbi:tenascin-R [Elysia marginata]|uniref:Tenascin-R n=1 Tax=Elysia marginata TaxID=1093978 RepID=A0AAV4HPC5_9GAST|nr:tenascin-R [Elysia marginata]